MDGPTIVVVDDEECSRTSLILCLRRLGMRALGVDLTVDAVALLEALDADITLVHNDDDDAALELLRQRSRVVKLGRAAPLDEVVVELLRELGRPDAAALIN